MKADGFSLDDKRNPIAANDIDDIQARWKNRGGAEEAARLRTDSSFLVPCAEIAATGYDLSINRYKEVTHAVVSHDAPQVILSQLADLEAEIQAGIQELQEMVG